jgi:hypothetical protein
MNRYLMRAVQCAAMTIAAVSLIESSADEALAGGKPQSAVTSAGRSIGVHDARVLCMNSPVPRVKEVSIHGFLVPRLQIGGSAGSIGIGALFGTRQPVRKSYARPWPPPGGLRMFWGFLSMGVPGIVGYPNFRWVILTGFLNCRQGDNPLVRVQSARLWHGHPRSSQ